MEDDKKKRKKNKKKKNKQANEATESDTLDAKELSSDSQSHVPETGPDNNGQVSEIVDASNDSRGHRNPDGDGHLANDNEKIDLSEEDKQHWLDCKATLEGKLKELQAEKDAQIQKEAFLEERIKELMKENDGNSEKEATIKEKLSELEKENAALIQKEGSLEQEIQRLQREMEAQLQKEGNLEQKIQYLQKGMDDQLQKEGSFEQKIELLQREVDAQLQKEGSFEHKIQFLQREMDDQLQKEASLEKEILELKGEKNSWVQKEVSLEENSKHMERERDFWISKENLAKESIASLTMDNTKLRTQVVELEFSREKLFSEIQQLKEFISSQQLQINNLEMDKKTSENGHLNSEAEAALAQVERLMAENSELVEKVNELRAKLELSGVRTGQFPSDGLVPGAVTAPSAEITGASSPLHDQASGASQIDSIQSLEDVMVKDERNGELENVNPGLKAPNSSELTQTDEIVQIPLDENEVKESNQEIASQSDEDVDVSLTDSPLIGAPFRIISFVARYVSGADLVHKK